MNKFHGIVILVLLITGILHSNPILAVDKHPKPRIIITADPELDDNNSLIRFLLYSSEFKVEGLIYASSQFHWKGDGKGTKFMVPGREYTKYGLNLCPCESYRWKKNERFIHEVVEAYSKVYINLRVHDSAYPSPTYLQSKIKYGNIEFEGEFSKNTEGSDLIKSVILDDQPGPVFITAWGGQSTIARALKSIEEDNVTNKDWNKLKARLSKKIVLLPSGEQDNVYKNYIQPVWPDIDYRQYKSGPNYGYGAQLIANAENAPLLTSNWMQNNIRSKGALGEIYRVWGDGKQMVKGDPFDYFGLDGYSNEELKKMGYIVWMPKQEKGSWLGEGDTGTFMNILSNGLDADEKETPGGWGGRPFYPNPETYVDPFSNDTSKVKELVISQEYLKKMEAEEAKANPYPNFFPAAQHDFAARMNWSVTSDYKLANHAPIVSITGKKQLFAKPGEKILLSAKVQEPDGNDYSVKWWQFSQHSGIPTLRITQKNKQQSYIQIPADAKKQQQYFVVVEVVDDQPNSLTSYQQIKITIK